MSSAKSTSKSSKQSRRSSGLMHPGMTLVEVMMAVALIIIAALGSLCYEYLTVDHVRHARAQLTATRIVQLLIEDWKSTGGAEDYDPQELDMNFSLPPNVGQGSFMTVIDGIPLYITTNSTDVTEDKMLLWLNVTVRWKHDFTAGDLTDSDPSISFDTYVRKDG